MKQPAPEPSPRHQHQARLALSFIVTPLILAKLGLNGRRPMPDSDGYLYTDVAQHVERGLGLMTDVSSFHAGFSYFPHETTLYPLWPLLFGHISRLAPMDWIALWLPTLFYLACLPLAYVVTNRALPGTLIPRLPWLRSGHVAVLLVGSARHFFWYSSVPYTEALAYCLLLIAFWRGHGYAKAPSGLGAAEMGFWLGLCFLTRSQMIVALIAWLGAVLLASRGEGRQRLYHAEFSVGAFALTLLPWLVYLFGFIPHLKFSTLLAFHTYQETPLLSPIQALWPTDGALGWLLDRAQGIPIAFRGPGRYSYWNIAGPLHFAVPLAVITALLASRARGLRGAAKDAFIWLRSPAHTGRLFILLFCIGGALSLHTIHKGFADEWNFGLRHGLAALPLFIACAIYALRGPTVVRLASALLITGAAVVGFVKLGGLATGAPYPDGPRHPALMAWAKAKRAQHGEGLIVASSRARMMAAHTTGIGFHGVYGTTSAQDLITMADELGAAYVVVRLRGRSRYAQEADAFLERFEAVNTDLDGFTVFAPRSRGDEP